MSIFRLAVLATLCAALVRPAAAQTNVFSDEFDSGKLSGSWIVYGNDRELSRTIFGNKPLFAKEGNTKYMRLKLDTYNSKYPGSYLTGTEIHTKTQFPVGNGVQIEARLRAPGLPPGIVWAFFMLGERGQWPDTYARDEIDFENLSTQGGGSLWTNIFNDVNPNTRTGSDLGMITPAPGFNPNNWTIFKIRWYPDRVEWWINNGSGDILIRTESSPALVTDDLQSIRFNIWASDASWTAAYGDLPVTANKNLNTSYYCDIDYVRMTSIGPRGTIGTGDGLRGDYFDNDNFTAPIRTRVDPTINFDWLNSPMSGVSEDTFSVRWTGQVQAQFTETYTFHAKADDGVRLWVNNKLLIDQWGYTPNNEYSGSIALKAGTKYAIKMEFFDNTYGATAQLRWSSNSTPKTIVPKSQLYSQYKPPADKVKPSATINAPTHTYTYQSYSQASGTASDNVGLTYVTARLYRVKDKTYWTGYTWGPYSTEVPVISSNEWKNWTFPMPSLIDSKYSLRITAKDAAGNVGTSSIVDFTIDNAAPTVKVTAPVPNGSYPSNFPRASGAASDVGGLASVQCILQNNSTGLFWDGDSWTGDWTENLANGTSSWTYAFPVLAAGNYTFWAVSRDWVGNYAYSPATSFTVK